MYRLLGTVREPGLLVAAVLLAVVTMLTYANSFDCGLVLDNYLIVGEDTRLKAATWDNVKLIFSRGYWWPTWESDLFRPLTTFSYMVNYAVLGNERDPRGYHIVNLLLHTANTLMFYGLVLATVRRNWTALAAAAIFAVHPLNTESVTNIVGRADLLVAFCVLGGLHLHRRSYGATPLASLINRLLLGLLALAGVFCKESAVVIVFALWLYDMSFHDLVGSLWKLFRSSSFFPMNVVGYVVAFILLPTALVPLLGLPKECLILLPMLVVIPCGMFLIGYNWRKDPEGLRSGEQFLRYGWQSYVAIVPAVIALLVARYIMLANSPVFGQIGADNPIACAQAFTPHVSDNPMVQSAAAWVTKRMTAVKVIGYYAALFVWPRVLSCDYSYDQIPLFRWTFTDPNDIDCWLGLLGCILSAVVMVRSYWTNKALFFFLSFFWIGSGFFLTANLMIDIGSIMGERFVYLPMVGAVGSLAAVMPVFVAFVSRVSGVAYERLRWVALAATCVAVVALGTRSYYRNYDWMDEISLWTSATDACPDSFKVYKGLAGAIAGVNIEQTEPERLELLGLTKESDEIDVLNQAIRVCEMGRKILDREPMLPYTDMPNGVFQDIARYYLNKGDTLTRRVDPAMANVPPDAMQAYASSAEALERARDMDRAVNSASRVSRLERGVSTDDIMDVGNYRIYQNLGVAYLRLRRFDEAVQAFKDMRRLEPMSADVYFNLGITMMQQQRAEDAARHILQALVLKSDWPEAWDRLQMLFNVMAPGAPVIHVDPATARRNLAADHPLVRRLLNEAIVGLVQVLIDTKRWEQARQMINLGTGVYGVPNDLMGPLLWQIPRGR